MKGNKVVRFYVGLVEGVIGKLEEQKSGEGGQFIFRRVGIIKMIEVEIMWKIELGFSVYKLGRVLEGYIWGLV